MQQNSMAISESNASTLAVKDSGTVLVVEDDPRMQKVLQRLFHEEGYRVIVAGDGRTGLDSFHAYTPVAVVLDLILPEISGRDLCKRLKTISADTPVIILSAITEVVDKVLLLELGADDYVTKPFSPREFKLLRFFTANAERVLTREALLNDVWGYNSYPTTRTVDNLILKLRQKLELDPANPRHLLTVHGSGYKFVP